MSISYHKQSQSFEIPVIVKIDQNKLGFEDRQEGETGRRLLDNMIEQGLRANLNLQSLLTGKMEVELDFHPNTRARLVGRSKKYPEIPTIFSSMEKLTSALEELPLQRMINRVIEILDTLQKTLSGADFPSLAVNLVTVMQRLEQITTQLEKATPELTTGSLTLINESRAMISEVRKNLDPLIHEWILVAADSRSLVKRLDSDLSDTVKGLDKTLVSGQAALQQVRQSAASVDSLIGVNSPLMTDLDRALEELAAAARSIRIMAEYLERHPEALWRGKR